MRNAGLEEAQAGTKIAGRNINKLSYADDTTLMSGRKAEKGSVCTGRKHRMTRRFIYTLPLHP